MTRSAKEEVSGEKGRQQQENVGVCVVQRVTTDDGVSFDVDPGLISVGLSTHNPNCSPTNSNEYVFES